MDPLFVLGMGARVLVIILGIASMLCLFYGRAKRRAQWSTKMKDIWLCHFIFVYATVQGNIEYLFRGEPPTGSIVFFIFVLIWTIKGVFNGDMYVNETPVCVHPELHPEVRFRK